jgi:ethanolaminephosphotransferase
VYRLTLINKSRYGNVFRSLKKGESGFLPFLRLMPFCISVILHVAFVSSPLSGKPHKDLAHSALSLPYMCFWGLEFAHQVRAQDRIYNTEEGLISSNGAQVGRMITAHVTKTPFPYWDPMWLWILFGALDGHAKAIFGRSVYFLIIRLSVQRAHSMVSLLRIAEWLF